MYNNMHWFSSIVANAKTQELQATLLPLETESFLHVTLEYMFACIARSLLSLLLFTLVSLCSHSIQNGKCSRRTEFEASGSSHHRAYRADSWHAYSRVPGGGRAWCTSLVRRAASLRLRALNVASRARVFRHSWH